MSVIVNEVARNLSAANGFYRSESYSLDISATAVAITALKSYIIPAFANAGNFRGIVLSIMGTTTYLTSTRDVTVDLEEAKTVGSFNTSTERINITSHGLTDLTKVRFTSTGTLPTGLTTTGTFYVRNATANDFQVSTTPTGSITGLSGTPSGTATCWVTRATSIKTSQEIFGLNQKYMMATNCIIPFLFTPYAVDTTANKWRISVIQGAGTGTLNIGYNVASTIPFYVAWCDNAVSFSTTNDLVVSVEKLTIDMDCQFKPIAAITQASTTATYGICGILCSPNYMNCACDFRSALFI